MNTRRCVRGAMTTGLLMLLSSAGASAGFMLNPSVHGSLAEIGGGLIGAVDLGLSAGWLPIPELVVGLDVALIVPLDTGNDAQQPDLILQACPVIWLRFGEDDAWGFVKAGLGVAAHLIDEGLDPVMVAVAGGGFVVAPSSLPFHFGFEVSGELDITGGVDTHVFGLGGFVGWLF